jgi:hypothetical protein
MNRKTLLTSVLIGLVALSAVAAGQSFTQSDVAQIRQATAQFHVLEAAQAAGYSLVPGLDFCFENPGVGGMGFHYIDTAELGNTTLNLKRPEALVYVPSPDGLRLGAVEYIVPKNLWDATGNTQPPSLNGIPLHLEASLGVYILHVWAWKNNPAGTFEDWNPAVARCP